MDDIRYEIKRNGYKLIVAPDMEPDNPREKYNLGDMRFFGDYSHLGDQHEFKDKWILAQ